MTASRFDLQQLAENGLKRGFTTGTCATAAVKAALIKLVCNETPDEVNVSLPDGVRYLTFRSIAFASKKTASCGQM